MPKQLAWEDAEDIGILLSEAHPEIDPLAVRFTDLHKYVVDLPDFKDDPKKSDKEHLQLEAETIPVWMPGHSMRGPQAGWADVGESPAEVAAQEILEFAACIGNRFDYIARMAAAHLSSASSEILIDQMLDGGVIVRDSIFLALLFENLVEAARVAHNIEPPTSSVYTLHSNVSR